MARLESLHAVKAAGDHAQFSTIEGNLRNRVILDRVIRWLRHLFCRRQIEPKLHAEQPLRRRQLFLVLNAAARCHPLHLAVGNRVLVAKAVAVHHFSAGDVADRLNAAVRMHREARLVRFRLGAVEAVEHEKRIKRFRCWMPQHAHKIHACAVKCLLTSDLFFYGSIHNNILQSILIYQTASHYRHCNPYPSPCQRLFAAPSRV